MDKKHLFDNPANVRRLLYALHALCAILLLADFAFDRHAEHPVEALWGFYALYGFVACVTLVLLAKGLRRMVVRREDHYGD